MKHYPSIEKFKSGKIKLHTFAKYDGSNIRIEYSKKRGWFKFGTRTRLFDETDDIFGNSIALFNSTLNEKLTEICSNNKWEQAIVFMEFWGEKSFAGVHIQDDPKTLTVIDIAVNKKGIISPREFVKTIGDLGAHYLGELNWTPGFIEQIKNAEIDGITFEGVVGKVLDRNRLMMYKAKTQRWVDKVKEVYGYGAERIINS